jgi:hypothetical protein
MFDSYYIAVNLVKHFLTSCLCAFWFIEYNIILL